MVQAQIWHTACQLLTLATVTYASRLGLAYGMLQSYYVCDSVGILVGFFCLSGFETQT